jgi:hypothetical protein
MAIEHIPAIKAAWDLAKGLRSASAAINDANFNFKISELILALADAKIEEAERTELILSLQKQINAKSDLEFVGDVYVRKTENGKEGNAWCPTCFDSKGLEIRLHNHRVGGAGQREIRWICKSCKNLYR